MERQLVETAINETALGSDLGNGNATLLQKLTLTEDDAQGTPISDLTNAQPSRSGNSKPESPGSIVEAETLHLATPAGVQACQEASIQATDKHTVSSSVRFASLFVPEDVISAQENFFFE